MRLRKFGPSVRFSTPILPSYSFVINFPTVPSPSCWPFPSSRNSYPPFIMDIFISHQLSYGSKPLVLAPMGGIAGANLAAAVANAGGAVLLFFSPLPLFRIPWDFLHHAYLFLDYNNRNWIHRNGRSESSCEHSLCRCRWYGTSIFPTTIP